MTIETEHRYFNDTHDSQELMEHILRGTKVEGAEVCFECPLGMGQTYVQRVRMRISRLRNKVLAEGQVVAKFRLLMNIRIDKEREREIVTIHRNISDNNMLDELMAKTEVGLS